jgi:cytochrome c-type biogenesis protein CcmH/NrfG
MGNYTLAEVNLLKAVEKMSTDGTVQDHVASLYFKTGRLKQAVDHWQLALNNWAHTAPPDVDSSDVARVQKELESTRVRIAQQESQ